MFLRAFSFLLLFLVFTQLNAQEQNNTGPSFAPYPESGSWFAADDSRTGFFIDVQNGRLAGAYFGFDSDGENVWLLFNGILEPVLREGSPEFQDGWQLTTALTQSANGGCILDCDDDPGQALAVVEVGQIHLEFLGRVLASFSIDDGEPTPIIPLYFGTSATIVELASGPLVVPELEGTWVVTRGTRQRNSDQMVIDNSPALSAGIIEIGPSIPGEPPEQNRPPEEVPVLSLHAPILRDTAGFFPEDTSIICTQFQDFETDPPTDFITCDLFGGDIGFPSSPQRLGILSTGRTSDSRIQIFVVTLGGTDGPAPLEIFDAYRLDYN